MKKKYLIILILLLLLSINIVYAQKWKEMMLDPHANFYDIQREFNAYYKDKIPKPTVEMKEQEDEAMGGEYDNWKQFKRWEYLMAGQVSPSGELPDWTKIQREYEQYRSESQMSRRDAANSIQSTGNWTSMNPTNTALGNSFAGRVNRFKFDPSNSNTIYACTSNGGLWKTIDNGLHWVALTDVLIKTGTSDLAIDPKNTKILYLATGDCRNGFTGSMGLVKSIDGGLSWNGTGLTGSIAYFIYRLLIQPSNSNVLIVSCDAGVFRSTDAGATWMKVLSGTYRDMAFSTNNPNVLYIAGDDFRTSTDGGATFTVNTSLPSGITLFDIGVTPNDPNYIYLLASVSGSGYVYLSTDGGINFTQKAALNNNPTFYNSAIAVSPGNKNEVVVGLGDVNRSTDGAVTFSSGMVHGGHADTKDLNYLNATTLYMSCDGGLFKTTNIGTNWYPLNNGLNNYEFWAMSCSALDPNTVVSGWQDNGCNLYHKGGVMSLVSGGDGMVCFIDWSDTNYVYTEYQSGGFERYYHGSGKGITSGITETGQWVTTWMQDPVTPSTLYAGIVNVWKSTDRGDNWTVLGTIGSTDYCNGMAVAPSNPNCIYVVKPHNVYKSTNGGVGWTDITGSLPVGSISLNKITVSSTDANKVYVCCDGYSANEKVYSSSNGGTTWNNISAGLPNTGMMNIVYENGSQDALYVSGRIGVYYKNNTMTQWQNYSTGLINTEITDLSIQYSSKKIRAGSYGRGLWQSDLYSAAMGIAEKTSDNKVLIYPNPTDGNLNVEINSSKAINLLISIYNLIGQQVFSLQQNNVQGGIVKLDLSGHVNGVYLVQVKNDQDIITQKVILNR